jgi:hypothetical protein
MEQIECSETSAYKIQTPGNHPEENIQFTQVAADYQPAATWVNTTRYCKYSQVLLMMGENIARNM